MGHRRLLGSALVVLATCVACKLPGATDEKAPPATAVSTAPATPAAPPAATASAPPAAPAAAPASASAGTTPGKEYPLTGVTAAASDCKDAWAVLAAVPAAVHDKPDFIWRFARQVFLANRFGYGIPEAPGEVVFFEGPHKPTGGVAVVAHCTSGSTCNQVAAAYKTAVPTSKPEVVCAAKPPTVDPMPTASVLEFDMTPERGLHVPVEKNLPAKDDTVSQCVRLSACKAARDKRLDGDPAIECQKKPGGFKLSCAAKKTCAEVLACTGE